MPESNADRTEKPTEKKLQDARQEGRTLVSTETVGVVSMVGGVVLLFVTMSRLHAAFGDIFREVIKLDCTHTWTPAEIVGGVRTGALMLGKLLAFPLIGVCVLAVVGTWGQIGVYLETKPLAWKLDDLDPTKGMKRVLPSMENLVKLLFALAKILIIAGMVYTMVRRDWETILMLPSFPLSVAVGWAVNRIIVLLLKVLVLMAVLAAVDYLHKRKKHIDGLMMSKQEVKDENRNTEGDPMVKGRLRQKMKELTLGRLIAEVPKADLVLVNPVHVAVALRYRPGYAAPRVVAKGLRKRALRIKQLARDAGVPVVEDPPLARALYRETKAGGFIPTEFFATVAVILARLQREGRRRFTT